MFEDADVVTILPGGGLSGEVASVPKKMLRYVVSGSVREIEEEEYHQNGITNVHRVTRVLVKAGNIKGLLTDSEFAVFNEILLGITGDEIAYKLGIAGKTVKFHSGNIYKIFKVKGKAALISLALL